MQRAVIPMRWVLISCVLLGACPDDDDSATNHGSPCAAHAAWEKRCDSEQPYWGETECLDNSWQDVREAFVDAMVACFETLECDASDDRCEAAGLEAIGITDEEDVADDAVFQMCLARNSRLLGERRSLRGGCSIHRRGP